LDCVIVFLFRGEFRSGAVATKIADRSGRQVRLLRYNNLNKKSGKKRLIQSPSHRRCRLS
jgi:hypothetical protein